MTPIALGDTETALGVLAVMAALTYALPGLVRAAVRQHRRDAAAPAAARHVARYRP